MSELCGLPRTSNLWVLRTPSHWTKYYKRSGGKKELGLEAMSCLGSSCFPEKTMVCDCSFSKRCTLKAIRPMGRALSSVDQATGRIKRLDQCVDGWREQFGHVHCSNVTIPQVVPHVKIPLPATQRNTGEDTRSSITCWVMSLIARPNSQHLTRSYTSQPSSCWSWVHRSRVLRLQTAWIKTKIPCPVVDRKYPTVRPKWRLVVLAWQRQNDWQTMVVSNADRY